MSSSGSSKKHSTANFYAAALENPDIQQTKRCKSVEEQGCGRRKSIDDFGWRTRYWANGEPHKQVDGWCKVCQNRRARLHQKAEYEKKKLPPIRHHWDGSKGKFRILRHNETVGMRATESDADEAVADLKARDRIYSLFFTIKPGKYVWNEKKQKLVSR